MAARRKSSNAEDQAGPSFEDALAGLESIVEAMENDRLPLEDLISQYEKGSALLLRCESILNSARERIELITLRNQNPTEPETESGNGGTADFPSTSAEPDDSDDDDIRLF